MSLSGVPCDSSCFCPSDTEEAGPQLQSRSLIRFPPACPWPLDCALQASAQAALTRTLGLSSPE